MCRLIRISNIFDWIDKNAICQQKKNNLNCPINCNDCYNILKIYYEKVLLFLLTKNDIYFVFGKFEQKMYETNNNILDIIIFLEKYNYFLCDKHVLSHLVDVSKFTNLSISFISKLINIDNLRNEHGNSILEILFQILSNEKISHLMLFGFMPNNKCLYEYISRIDILINVKIHMLKTYLIEISNDIIEACLKNSHQDAKIMIEWLIIYYDLQIPEKFFAHSFFNFGAEFTKWMLNLNANIKIKNTEHFINPSRRNLYEIMDILSYIYNKQGSLEFNEDQLNLINIFNKTRDLNFLIFLHNKGCIIDLTFLCFLIEEQNNKMDNFNEIFLKNVINWILDNTNIQIPNININKWHIFHIREHYRFNGTLYDWMKKHPKMRTASKKMKKSSTMKLLDLRKTQLLTKYDNNLDFCELKIEK
uniref:Uncharacterized protein n=1 Tax=viral metagenome TaxID=1070528 RepID=A0A6C0LSC1_9ZZZZ